MVLVSRLAQIVTKSDLFTSVAQQKQVVVLLESRNKN